MQQQTINPPVRDMSRDAIEAQLELDRAALAASLIALQDRLSIDALWSDGVALAKSKVAPFGQVLVNAVYANPIAVALTTSGLGWIGFGNRASRRSVPSQPLDARLDAVSRWEDEGGQIAHPAHQDFGWIVEADDLCARAAQMLGQINAAGRAGLAPAKVLEDCRADVMAALTKDVRRVMAQGLEDMAQDARDRAVATRERTYDLHHQARTGTPWHRGALAAGAIAVVGSIIAALFPRHASEDPRPADQPSAKASEILRDEQARIDGSFQRIAQMLATDTTR